MITCDFLNAVKIRCSLSDKRVLGEGACDVKKTTYLLLSCFSVACNSGDFTTAPNKAPRQVKASAAEGAEKKDSDSGKAAVAEGGQNGSSGNTPVEELGQGRKKASFSYGPRSAKADFLFVIDNSSSMSNDVANVRSGFESLSAARWPADTKIAVMTTMPGNPANLNAVHPAVDGYNAIDKEPGFLSFMSETARANFRTANAAMGDRLPEPMCLAEWFKPDDKNNNGKTCLSAAIQTPFTGVGVEAGLVAVSQILDKRRQVFRMNSNAHIVFVSDTQDPGKDPNDGANIRALNDLRPNFEALKSKIMANSGVSGVKLHGVTPSVDCSAAENVAKRLGTPYQDAIRASGGTWLDFCEGNTARSNYRPVAEQIVANTLPEPVFVLPEAVKSLVQVEVAGQVVDLSRVTLLGDKKSVRIEGLSPSSDVNIAIVYQL